jgi:leucyl aminopeptidase (aminopeptidase T)
MTGIMLDDEGVLGSAHVGIGTNITLGGTLKAAIHYDLVFWKPTIELDGIKVMENGEIRFSID